MKDIKKELFAAGVLIGITFFVWSVYDNQEYFKVFNIHGADASTATTTINATVGTGAVSLNISSGSTVNFGTITSGTPRYSATAFNVNANDTVNVAVGRKRSNPAHTLASSANTSIFINDTNDIRAFTGCVSPVTVAWVNGSSNGLGYSLYKADENKDTSCWGTGVTKSDSANKYASLQASASASTAWTTITTGSAIKASVAWILDVTSGQQATTYTGDVIITATATP